MHSVTQDMRYRQTLLEYAQKNGVSRASRKYNKSRSYIHFWKARYDGTKESLADRSRRPHSHPNQHTSEELKLIRDMRRRNPKLGMIEFWGGFGREDIAVGRKACSASCGNWTCSPRKSRADPISQSPTSRCSIRGSACKST